MSTIQIVTNLTKEKFNDLVGKDLPFVIRSANFGRCLEFWNVEYLQTKIADGRKVPIHVGKNPLLDFTNKNFQYKFEEFGTFLQKCFAAQSSNELVNKNDYDDCSNYYYLRSIGDDKRGREIANLKKHYPSIADDVSYPEFIGFCMNDSNCSDVECDKRHIFSTVLRISSSSVTIWTHYDVLDNILLQIRGRKRVILFPPNDAEFLYLKGDKSEIIDLDADDIEKRFPLYRNCSKFEVILEERDALFIPAMWFHNTKALEFSIGINMFWKDFSLNKFYDLTDVYGNKDLIPGKNSLNSLKRILTDLNRLPKKYRNFYVHLMISVLRRELQGDSFMRNCQ
ncbi:tRNA wybutosine-synthesizing protein 5 [Sarcoptes scabiei]|uniref:tRNA wybutosine-synthesizing protein 5 n=1 Tax=Sarcoptes scabiei TaxID=52283 RepID=A0A834R2V2_SARSC|nr:tRNA wybutosine-synthesizing protein 5 [Sarcoptes scabiei]